MTVDRLITIEVGTMRNRIPTIIRAITIQRLIVSCSCRKVTPKTIIVKLVIIERGYCSDSSI
jgi:hypothetical protein